MNTREEVWVRSYCSAFKAPEPSLVNGSVLSSELSHNCAVDAADRLLRLFDKRFPQEEKAKFKECKTCGGWGGAQSEKTGIKYDCHVCHGTGEVKI